jgi:hypothetical protein
VNQGNGPDDPAQKDQPSQGRRITPLEGAFILGSAFHQPNNRQSQSRPCVENPAMLRDEPLAVNVLISGALHPNSTAAAKPES